MIAYILLIARTVVVSSQTALAKIFQLGFNPTLSNFLKYNLLNGLFACIVFYTLNGFRLNVNLPTLIYSGIFAVLVIIYTVGNILAMGRTSIPMVYIISSAGSVILPTLFGIFLLGDIPTPRSVIAIVLLMAAVLMSYSKPESKSTKSSLLIYITFFLVNGATIIVTKLYADELEAQIPRVCDEKSFYMLTNMIIVACCILLAVVLLCSKKVDSKKLFKPLSLKQTVNICARTVLSNIESLVMIWAVGLISLSLFTVTSSALIIISNTVLSIALFKEKLMKKQWIATALALAAIIVGA